MIRQPPRTTLSDTHFPYRTRVRATGPEQDAKNTGSFGVRQIFLRSGGLRAGLCIFAALDALVDFLAVNGHVLRRRDTDAHLVRSEEHTSELPSLMRILYVVFCLKKKKYHRSYRLSLHTHYSI